MLLGAFVKQRQFGDECGQHLRAVRALLLRLGQIEAQHIAFAPLAVTNHHLLDMEVVSNRLVAAGAGQHLGLDLLHLAHRHGEDVAPKPA